jgi:hypothetical protein
MCDCIAPRVETETELITRMDGELEKQLIPPNAGEMHGIC